MRQEKQKLMVIKKHIGSLWQTGINFFTKGHQRSLEAKKNIISSLLIKGISIAIGLVLVPLTIHYVNPSQYGIWLTLSSMIAWISFFDIGFTHGLRNKFAEAKAKGDTEKAKIYISTTYYYISAIFLVLWILLLGINQFISWHKLLKLPATSEAEISRLAMLIFSYFCFQFIFRVINTVLTADQQPAKASLIDMLGQLFSLIIIFILTKVTQGSLLNLGLAVGVAPIVISLAANFFFFNTKYKPYKPSIKYVRKEYAKDIMQLGGKFFVLQIAAMIQFETILVLIFRYKGGAEVTNYSTAFKYFSVLNMVFSILLSPLWTGVTDAYNKQDYDWIKNAVKKYLKIVVLFIGAGIFMLLVSNKIYDLWIGNNVINVSFSISLMCLIHFSTGMFASIFVSVINGIGALKIQFYAAIIAAVVFISLSLLFMEVFKFGTASILIASVISNVFGYIIAPIQVYNIFYKKSKAAVWYK